VLVAVHVRLPDDQRVTVGRYGSQPDTVTAAQAVAAVRELDDPRGYEVFVPRAISAAEVRRVHDIPQGVGRRYLPAAHAAGLARAQRAYPAAGTGWRGYAAGSRTTNHPGRRASWRRSCKPPQPPTRSSTCWTELHRAPAPRA
jgi:hypothetical protein